MSRKITFTIIAVLFSASIVWGGSDGKNTRFDAGKYFSSRCAGCHAGTGRGNPVVAKKLKIDIGAMDLRGDEAKAKTDKELATIILKGDGKMPAFGKSLSGEQAGDLVAYIRKMDAVAPKKPGAGKPMGDGASIFASRSCGNCHGKDGKGVARVAKMLKADAEAMDLTGKEAKGRTDAELAGIITNGADGGKMPAYAGKMTKEEIDAVVAHIRGLK